MPVKFDWMAISRVEMSDCTCSWLAGSPAAGAAAFFCASTGLDSATLTDRARRRAADVEERGLHHAPDSGTMLNSSDGLSSEIEQDADGHAEHHQREQRAQLLAAQLLSGAHAELAADDAADHEQEGKHDVERVIERRVQQGDDGGDEDDLKDRRADDDIGRHAQQIDQRRHHDEAAADAEERGEQADQAADHERRDGADIEARARKAHLERQAVDPVVLAWLCAPRRSCRLAARRMALRLSHSISAPITPRKHT